MTMKQQTISRRSLLDFGGRTLGTLSLASLLPKFARAQTLDSGITATDLGYAWMLEGAGGNVFVIPGMNEDGVLMVDGGLAVHADAVMAAVAEVTGQTRVHTLINTHFHPEQTGMNERAGSAGATIIANQNTRMCLENSLLSWNYEGRYGPLAESGLPTQLITGNGKMKFAGQEIIYGYLPAAHTNGDIFLYFPILDTLVAGGPVTTGAWPVLDIRQGAWIGGLVNAYEILASVVSADTTVIPAHGPVTDGTAIIRMRNMYSGLHLDLAEQLNLGMGWDDVREMGLLDNYEDKFGDSDFFVETAHRSLQMAYVPD
jgi:cyclase